MKKSKSINKLTFTALMISLNVVFIIINSFFPVFSLLILIGIPFASSLVSIKTNIKYSLLYIFCSILICFFIDYQTVLFYLISSLISGFVFGTLIKKKIHSFFIIIISSLINIAIQFLSIEFVYLIYKINFIDIFCQLINIKKEEFLNISLSFFFLISVIQTLFSYIILEEEASKFNISINDNLSLFYPTLIGNIFISILSIIFLKTPILSYFFTSISLVFSIYLLYYIFIYKSKFIRIISLVIFALSFLFSLIFFHGFKEIGFHFIFNIFSIITLIISVIFIIYILNYKKEKISQDLFHKNY